MSTGAWPFCVPHAEGMPHQFLSSRTLRALYDSLAWHSTVGHIDGMFSDHGFRPGLVPDAQLRQGDRRQAAQRYMHAMDFSDHAQVQRLLRVIEDFLSDQDGEDWAAQTPLLERLERDGYEWKDGRLHEIHPLNLADVPLGEVDETVIREHLDRLTRLRNDGDTAGVLGSSKELVETTAKLVMRRLDVPFREDDDIPALTKGALRALKLHPDAVAPTPETREAVYTVLGSLGGLAGGMATLRNKGGTGHGRDRSVLLQPRHADLAYGAASTWVRFVLATLSDPGAPWRKGSAPAK